MLTTDKRSVARGVCDEVQFPGLDPGRSLGEDMHSEHATAIEIIGRVEAVPTILATVCGVTGMGFAAVARVTAKDGLLTRFARKAYRRSIAMLRPAGFSMMQASPMHAFW